ncbi:MAG: NAD+ synthase [Candidatus Dormibacteria bacterium]
MIDLEVNAAIACRILASFIHDEVSKVGKRGVVVALSGGVDSALAAWLAVEGLGAGAVLGVALPYRQSSPESLGDARAVAETLGLELLEVDISPQIDAYFETRPEADRTRRGNKMARERMSILYDVSAEREALVLGTSNKSELLLGYSTLWGDSAHALNPLGDLYKTQVYQLARHLGLPKRVLEKPPSADLFPGQSDEAELGFGYADADLVLFQLVDQRRRPEEVVAEGADPELVQLVRGRIRATQFKRRLPLIAKLSQRSVGQDFRYPRDWGH